MLFFWAVTLWKSVLCEGKGLNKNHLVYFFTVGIYSNFLIFKLITLSGILCRIMKTSNGIIANYKKKGSFKKEKSLSIETLDLIISGLKYPQKKMLIISEDKRLENE